MKVGLPKRTVSTILILFIYACAGEHPTIKIKGSDTEVNLAVQLAEAFHHEHPEIFVSISGGGSGLGIASLLNGTADIANSSRNINTTEIELFQEKNIRLDSFVFAQDAIAFIVSEALPIDSICIAELSRILDGTYKNWSTISTTNAPVTIYGRQSNSGTHEFISNKLQIEFSPYAKQMNGNAQIIEAIKNDPSGIGYVGAGYVGNGNGHGIKVLSISEVEGEMSVSPLDSKMILGDRYYFQRPLYQYFKSDDFHHIRPFLDFEKSKAGRILIFSAGYYPVK